MKIFKVSICLAGVSLFFGALCVSPCLASFTGTLSSPGGINGSGAWLNSTDANVVFSWTVAQNANSSWNYCYKLEVASGGGISHMIIETSVGFDEWDIIGTPSVLQGTVGAIEYGWFQDGPDDDSSIHGIKFDSTTGMTLEVCFDTWRMPVWGDFFAKDGQSGDMGLNAAWNAGFTYPDTDPLGAPASGSLDNHVLVPDTVIPTPGAILLGSIGVVFVGWLRRSRIL